MMKNFKQIKTKEEAHKRVVELNCLLTLGVVPSGYKNAISAAVGMDYLIKRWDLDKEQISKDTQGHLSQVN